ncbi:GntR family transcriptional regulator [Oceanobacillus oncorhynchi subsp. oncorhynchi]|uniref:GntR family transcriptional regulator n=1 Tax=Oceanobacillus TaxID=182709 RepID=UPI0030F9262A
MKQNQTQIAYDYILNKITENKIPQGYPVIEEDFAQQLNMSRTPVREAIKLLSVEGFIDIFPRKGAFVKVLSAQDISDCYEMIEAIEGMIAYLAAKNPSEEIIDQLNQYLDEMEKERKAMDFFSWKQNDIKFHRTIYKLCDNKLLIRHAEILFLKIYQIETSYIHGVNLEQAIKEHKLILEAIKNKDGEGAREYMQKNWHRARLDVLKYATQ